MDTSSWTGFLFYFPFFYGPKTRMNILWQVYKRSGKGAADFFQEYIQRGLAEGLTVVVVLDQYVECLLDIGPAWIIEHGEVHMGVIRSLMAQGATFPEERLTAARFGPGSAADIYEEVAGYEARAYLIDSLWADLKKVEIAVDWWAYEALPLGSMPVGMSKEWLRLGYLKYLSDCLSRYYNTQEEDDERWKEDYRTMMYSK